MIIIIKTKDISRRGYEENIIMRFMFILVESLFPNLYIFISWKGVFGSNLKVYINYKFDDEIYSITPSKIENKILVCFLKNKIVKILNYYFPFKNEFLFSRNDINDSIFPNNNGHFYKCIQITINNYVTSDKDYIKIWEERTENIIEIKKYEINAITYDLLLVDSDFFISSQSEIKTLTLYDIKNFAQINIISSIDCLDSDNSLFNIEDKYIIIGCKKGLGLLYIKTKELVQYIEYFNTEYNRISCDDDNNIFILNVTEDRNYSYYSQKYNIKIFTANIIENQIKIIKESDCLSSNEKNLKIISLSNDVILLWNSNIYSSKPQII